MKFETRESKLSTNNTEEICHYCHYPSTLQLIGNEIVCANCGTRVLRTTNEPTQLPGNLVNEDSKKAD